MRKIGFLLAAFLIILASCALADPSPRTSCLIFDPVITEDSANTVHQYTLFFKQSMESAGGKDIVIFNPESPLVKRALLEGSLPKNLGKSETSVTDACKAGQILGTSYVFITQKDTRAGHLQLMMIDTSNGEAVNMGDIDITATSSDIKSRVEDLGRQCWNRIQGLTNQTSNTATQQSSNSSADIITSAQKAIDAGQKDQAEEFLNQAVKQFPQDSEVRLARGRFYLSQGKLSEAIIELRTAVNFDPLRTLSRLWLADAYAQKGMYDDAEAEIKRGIALNPKDPQFYSELGKIYWQKGSTLEALRQLRTSIKLNPNDASVQLLYGDILLQLGNGPDALTAYQTAAKVKPETATYQRIAAAYAKAGKMTESLQASIQALGLSKLDADHQYQEASRLVDNHVQNMLVQYDVDRKVYQKGAMTKADFVKTCKLLQDRTTSLLKFLDSFTPSESAKQMHKQRNLGLSLLNQAVLTQIGALESNDSESTEDAQTLFTQAEQELSQARGSSAK